MSFFAPYPSRPTIFCGLFPVVGRPDDFPLLNSRVHYDLVDVQALANLIQTYTSNASSDVEIKYVFPLPLDASVCAFKAVIDGKRTIKGVVKEKEKAKAEYNEAVAQGRAAALLQQDNVEIFQVYLGNIRPKQTIEVHISFASVIAHDGSLDSLRLTFPSAIAPRYGVAPNSTLDYSGNFQRWPYHATKYTFTSALDFSVAVQMTSHIKSITSPSHPIAMKLGESTLESSTEFNPMKAHVSLSSPTLLEQDVVIVLSCQGLDRPRCTVESFSPEEGAQEYTDAYSLTLVPRFELPALPSQEYIFLVDRSGSMEGAKMNAVRSSLQIMLSSLPARGTSFNIISFGTQHSSLWSSSVTYSAESVKAASAYIDRMRADYGGTEIRAAIEAAFSNRSSNHTGQETPTALFVLTDGQAYDLDGVQSSITRAVTKSKANGGLLRVFCMGIGDAVSKGMCDVIARAGRGTAAFVGEREKPDHKLMGLLRAARGATVEDLSVDWGVPEVDMENEQDFEMVSPTEVLPQPPKDAAPISLFDENHVPENENSSLGPDTAPFKLPPPPRIQQAPSTKTLPPLYPGFRTNLFAIIRRSGGGNSAPSKIVRINGSVLGRPVQLEVSVTPAMNSEVSVQSKVKMLHVLAARALVQMFDDEEKEVSIFGIHKAKVLRVAERYGIASSETSFVAIDDDDKPVGVVHPAISAVALERSSMTVGPQMSLFGSSALFNAVPVQYASQSASFGLPIPSSHVSSTSSPLFGSSMNTHSAPAPGAPALSARPSGFGAFGSQAPAPPTMLFGQPSVSRERGRDRERERYQPDKGKGGQTAGFSIFGSAAQQQQQQQQQQSSPAMMGGLFGAAPQQKQPQQQSLLTIGGGLFGAAPQQPQQQFSPAMGGLFGVAPQQQQQSSPALGGGLFGALAPESSGVMNDPSPPQPGSAAPPTPATLPPTTESLAWAQSFEGSFVGSPALFRLLLQQPTAPKLPEALGAVDSLKETLWCTLLCVAFLETKLVVEKDVWSFIVEKAMAWVEEMLENMMGSANASAVGGALKDEAKRCIDTVQDA